MNSFSSINSFLFNINNKNKYTVNSFTLQVPVSGGTTDQSEWVGFNGTGQYVVLSSFNTPPSTTLDAKLAYLWVSSDYGKTFNIKTVNSSTAYGGYGGRQSAVNRFGFIVFAVNNNNGGGGMYLSSNAGDSFTRNNIFSETSKMQGGSINNTNTSNSVVCYAGCNAIGIYKRNFTSSFPDTNNFNKIYSTSGGVSSFTIASDLITQNVIYNLNGVYSTNGGSSWTAKTSTSPVNPPNINYPATYYYISPKETIFLASGYYYYYLSSSFTSGWSNISSRFTGLSTYQNNIEYGARIACTGDHKYIAIAQWFPVVTNGIYNNTVQCFISSDFGNNFTAIKIFDASSDPSLSNITITYTDDNTPKRILITAYNTTNIYYIDL
jgi:hypothetical protein